MFFGYYYDISTPYGDFRSEIQAGVNKYFNWAYIMLGDLSQLNDSFANWTAKTAIFGPDVNPTDTTLTLAALASIDTAAPYWDNVSHIYLDEMSSLDKTGLEAFITSLKAAITSRGLAQKPIIVNFPPDVLQAPGRWQANNIDIVGIDCYLELSQQDDDVATLLSNLIDNILVFMGPRNLVFTMQSYNTRGGDPLRWTNIPNLKIVQTTTYLKARNNIQVLGILPFNYGRDDPGVNSLSTRLLPHCIKTEHLRIFGAITGTAQPEDFTCGDVPVLVYFTQDLTCNMFCKELTCIIPASLSGMYRLVLGKTHDTLYTTITTPTQFTTIDVAIPNPFIETAPLGE